MSFGNLYGWLRRCKDTWDDPKLDCLIKSEKVSYHKLSELKFSQLIKQEKMIESQEQKRILNLSSATCTVICTMIGAGIFMTTGLYASELDSGIGILVVWMISGLLAICGSLCAIELASIWPEAGGNYIFIRNIFGRPFGFLAGFTMAFFGVTGSIAFVAANWIEVKRP